MTDESTNTRAPLTRSGGQTPEPKICPDHICPMCYHPLDACSHCDTPTAAGGQETPQWRPIETAWRDGRHFLALTKFMGHPVIEVIWWSDGLRMWNGAHGEQRFDGWMPYEWLLPAPPAGGE